MIMELLGLICIMAVAVITFIADNIDHEEQDHYNKRRTKRTNP